MYRKKSRFKLSRIVEWCFSGGIGHLGEMRKLFRIRAEKSFPIWSATTRQFVQKVLAFVVDTKVRKIWAKI